MYSQENAMRGPLLNMSPGLGASGVDMEYRRSSQGILRLSRYIVQTYIIIYAILYYTCIYDSMHI